MPASGFSARALRELCTENCADPAVNRWGTTIAAYREMRALRSYAIFETSTSLDDVDRFLRAQQPSLCCELRAIAGDTSVPRHEILVLGDDVIAAFRIVRSALCMLIDGADSGVIARFKIVHGADLLRYGAMGEWSAASVRPSRTAVPCHA